MKIRESHTLLSERVERGGPQQRITVAGKIAISLIVRENDDHIGRLGSGNDTQTE